MRVLPISSPLVQAWGRHRASRIAGDYDNTQKMLDESQANLNVPSRAEQYANHGSLPSDNDFARAQCAPADLLLGKLHHGFVTIPTGAISVRPFKSTRGEEASRARRDLHGAKSRDLQIDPVKRQEARNFEENGNQALDTSKAHESPEIARNQVSNDRTRQPMTAAANAAGQQIILPKRRPSTTIELMLRKHLASAASDAAQTPAVKLPIEVQQLVDTLVDDMSARFSAAGQPASATASPSIMEPVVGQRSADALDAMQSPSLFDAVLPSRVRVG